MGTRRHGSACGSTTGRLTAERVLEGDGGEGGSRDRVHFSGSTADAAVDNGHGIRRPVNCDDDGTRVLDL